MRIGLMVLSFGLFCSSCAADADDATIVLGAFSQRNGLSLPCGPECVAEHCDLADVPPRAEATLARFGIVKRASQFDRYCTFQIEPMTLDTEAEAGQADWFGSERGAYLVRAESEIRCDTADLGSAVLVPEIGLDQEVIKTDDGRIYEITVEAGIIGDPSGCFEEFGTWMTEGGRFGTYRQRWDGVRLEVELGPVSEGDQLGLLDGEEAR